MYLHYYSSLPIQTTLSTNLGIISFRKVNQIKKPNRYCNQILLISHWPLDGTQYLRENQMQVAAAPELPLLRWAGRRLSCKHHDSCPQLPSILILPLLLQS